MSLSSLVLPNTRSSTSIVTNTMTEPSPTEALPTTTSPSVLYFLIVTVVISVASMISGIIVAVSCTIIIALYYNNVRKKSQQPSSTSLATRGDADNTNSGPNYEVINDGPAYEAISQDNNQDARSHVVASDVGPNTAEEYIDMVVAANDIPHVENAAYGTLIN